MIRHELEKYFSDPYFVPKQVSEFGEEGEDEERFLAWIFMGAPGPGASLHVSIISTWAVYILYCGFIEQENFHESIAVHRNFLFGLFTNNSYCYVL